MKNELKQPMPTKWWGSVLVLRYLQIFGKPVNQGRFNIPAVLVMSLYALEGQPALPRCAFSRHGMF